MLKKSLALLSALFLLSASAHAAGIESILPKIQAKYASYQNKMESMVITKEMRMAQGIKTQVKAMVKGEKSRIEQTMEMPQAGSMITIIINDGQNIWSINPMMGKMKLPRNEADQQPKEAGAWWNYLAGAELLGEEKVNGRDTYAIQPAADSQLSFDKIWLDRSSLGMVQAIKGAMRLSNSDFRNTEGIDMPFTTEIYQGDKLMATAHVLSYEFGVNLSDDLFNPDLVPGGQNTSMQDMMQKILQAQSQQQ